MAIQQLSLITRQDRNQAISAIRKSISAVGGWILTHTLLSNMAATIVFELPCDRIKSFQDRLAASDLSPAEDLLPIGTEEVCVSLSITFLHDEPDLKRDVPAFG